MLDHTLTPVQQALVDDFITDCVLYPQPIDGLTPKMMLAARGIRAGQGRILSRRLLKRIIWNERADEMHDATLSKLLQEVCRRRPDIGDCIVRVHGRGYGWHDPTGEILS